MKYNPIRDWHYTMNANSPFDQGSSFLMSLDLISWKANESCFLEAALEQLPLLDDHYTVYAYPQLLTTLFTLKQKSNNWIALDTFCQNFLDKVNIDRTVLGLHNNKQGSISVLFNNFKEAIKKITSEANKAIIKEVISEEKYKDTYVNKEASIVLSYLYAILASNPEFLYSFQSRFDNETSINKFLQDAYDHEYGRLSFIIACRVYNIVDHENYRSNIEEHILKKIKYNNILTEPDLTELIIEAKFFSFNEEEDDPDEFEETEIEPENELFNIQLKRNTQNEFYNLKLYSHLKYNSKKPDTSLDDFFYDKLFSPIPTSNVEKPHLKNGYTITCWQFNLLYCYYLSNRELSAELFNIILFDPDWNISSNSIPQNDTKLTAIYKLKSSILSKGIGTNKKLDPEEIKLHTYSPFPNIFRFHAKDLGIVKDSSIWFQNEDEPFLYLRVSLFGFIASLYLSDNLETGNDFKRKLLRFSTYNMSFNKFYRWYLRLSAHDAYDKLFSWHLTNKKKHYQKTRKNNLFILSFGSMNQLIIQKALDQRIKSIPKLSSVDLTKDFEFQPGTNDYIVSSDSNKNDLYNNLILPDALSYWIEETYLSQTSDCSQTNFLSTIFHHEASLKISTRTSLKPYYKLVYFNQTKLSCLLSFPIKERINIKNYSYFSFIRMEMKYCKSSRSFLTAETKEELIKLLDEKTTQKVEELELEQKPELYRSVRILEIINNESLEDEYDGILENIIDVLHQELSSIKTNRDLDRYVRLQLIRLINNSLLRKDKYDKVRETIISLILEFGGIFDIDLLFNKLFEKDRKTGMFSTKEQSLQKKFIGGFYAMLDTDHSSGNLIESPYEVTYRKEKAKFIRKKINWMIYSACKENNTVISSISEYCNNNEIIKTYKPQTSYKDHHVDTVFADNNNVFIEPPIDLKLSELHSIYYDPNSYTANLLTKQEQVSLAKVYSGNPIEIKELDKKEWNNLNIILTDKTLVDNYKNSNWLADIIGLKSGLYNSITYSILCYSIDQKEFQPFPKLIMELPFFNRFKLADVFRLVLLSNNYRDPINNKKGHLWSLAFGINVFVEFDQYTEGTLELIEEEIKSIQSHYEGEKNPSRGLIAYFNIHCDKNESLLLNSETHPDNDQKRFDDSNIQIEYDLLPEYTESEFIDNEWVIEVKEGLLEEQITVKYNDAHSEWQTKPFNFGDFSWNPFTNILVEHSKPVVKSTPQEGNRKKLSESRKPKRKEVSTSLPKDENRENLDKLLIYTPAILKARFKGFNEVEIIDCRLPQNLVYDAESKNRIIWTNKFRSNDSVRIIKLSPSWNYYKSFFDEFDMGYNGYIDLRIRKENNSSRINIYLHTLKVTPFYLDDFINFYDKLSKANKRNLQIVFIGLFLNDNNKFRSLNHVPDPDSREYVFEFGIGRIIILKEDEITISGTKISKTSSVLFYGDKLNKINIKNNIVTAGSIDLSFTHSIYKESLPKERNLIHTLYIDVGKKRINKIVGSTISGNNPAYTHRNNGQAKLSEESKKYLMELYSDSEIDEIVLYGRVDSEAFLRSDGRHLEFNVIRLSGKPSKEMEGLMFFKADYIYFYKNTYRLKILPVLDKIAFNSVDEYYLNNCYIKKRDFSANAYRLVNLFNEKSDNQSDSIDTLKGRLLLVRVSYDKDKEKYIYSLLGSRESIASGKFQMPFRKVTSIEEQLNETNLEAIVVTKHEKFGKYIIELKPGIFFGISPANDDGFYTGDTIRVRKANNKIYFDLIIPSDERYFSQTKFVHILPKNNIVDIDLTTSEEAKKQLTENKYFIGADFPNIELSLIRNSSGEKLAEFFKNKGKLCLITNKNVNIELQKTFKYVPKIIFAHKKSSRVFINNDDGTQSHLVLPAYSISFQEKSLNDLIESIITENWRYIDKETFIWNDNISRWENKPIKNIKYVNSPVPVYSEGSNKFTLRYPLHKRTTGKTELDVKDLSKISLPTQALLSYLKGKNALNKKSIGIELTIVCQENKTIWLELSPGRIVETNTKFFRIGSTNLSLNDLATGLLSTGDRLILYLPETDYANDNMERVEVRAWVPSSRSAFNSDTILPCSNYNKEGYVELGAGIYKIVIPIQNERIRQSLSYFDSYSNYFKTLSKDPVNSSINCSMLYSMHGEIKLTLNNYNDYKIVLHNDEPYLKDWFSDKKIESILTYTGNYLPVTIEKIDRKRKTIIVSRKHQNRVKFKTRDLMFCTLLGKLDYETVLIKSGFLLLVNDIKEFSKYIPDFVLSDKLIKVLSKKLANRLCLVKSETGFSVGIGLSELTTPTTFKCEFIHVVSEESNPGIIIFNQVYKSLHFVSYQNCSWIKPLQNISRQQVLDLIFRLNPKPIQLYASFNPSTGICSLISTEQAKSEFANLRKDKNVSIEYIARLTEYGGAAPELFHHIVRSKSSDIYMLAESSRLDDIEKRDKAKVIYIQNGDKNVLTIIGEKEPVMDTYKLVHSTEDIDQNVDIIKTDKMINDLMIIDSKEILQNRLLNWGMEDILNKKYLHIYSPLRYLIYSKSFIDKHQIEPDSIGELKELCISIILDMGLRAIRERHSEVLVSKWLGHSETKTNKYDLWGRFNSIGRKIFNGESVSIDKEDYSAVENLHKVGIPLRTENDHSDFKLLGDALMIAIGQNANIHISHNTTPVIQTLITMSYDILSLLSKSKSKISIYNEDINFSDFQKLINDCNRNRSFFYLRENILIKVLEYELSHDSNT